jgi:hypothetical protein
VKREKNHPLPPGEGGGAQRRRVRGAALALIVLIAACAHLVEVQDRDTLYFGTARPNGVVSEIEWRTFVDEVITPRFPGFTEWSAEGHWKSDREATHVVEIIHPDRRANDEKVHEIIAEYKRRFRQEAVLLVRDRALAALE